MPATDQQQVQQEEEEARRAKREKEKELEAKEIQLTTKISDHDLSRKLGQARGFLQKGYRVQITIKVKRNERRMIQQVQVTRLGCCAPRCWFFSLLSQAHSAGCCMQERGARSDSEAGPKAAVLALEFAVKHLADAGVPVGPMTVAGGNTCIRVLKPLLKPQDAAVARTGGDDSSAQQKQ